ncbi:MAG: hypothetical protein MRZ66_01470 [Clostridiales bacterium]|nr:hypothetical protein [Clostridiales bacterium]
MNEENLNNKDDEKETISSEKNTQQKKKNNIMTYAIVMIVSVIIIILIAAMADDREEEIDNRIMETERANESIQNELVNLKDENYKLNKEIEKNSAALEEYNNYKTQLAEMTNAWNLYNSGDVNSAAEIVISIDSSKLDDNQRAYLDALCKIIGIDKISENIKNNNE